MREGGKLTSSSLFNSEGRSCALDLLRTISVTDGDLPHDPPHNLPQEANRSGWHSRSCRSRGAARATQSKHSSARADITTGVTRVARMLLSCPFVHGNQSIQLRCSATCSDPRLGGDEEFFRMSEKNRHKVGYRLWMEVSSRHSSCAGI